MLETNTLKKSKGEHSTPCRKQLPLKIIKNKCEWYTGNSHMSVTHNEFCHFQQILANLKGNASWAVEKSPLRNIQEHSGGEDKRDAGILQSHYCDPRRKIQEWCSTDAWWWATMLDVISWLWSTRPLRNRAQRTPISLSILALWWPSAPGIAAMWAWQHSTISVCSATWHWEAGIRWLHYCKWPAPVTTTNTRTHMWTLQICIYVYTWMDIKSFGTDWKISHSCP